MDSKCNDSNCVDAKEAVEQGLPAPPLDLAREFRMYKEMNQEQLREEKRQLQEEKNLLLRGTSINSVLFQY